ncbi:hypothetical protein M9435_006629 [Picochlorum sp. BPE23]|nr:hypothetical protein M9435_006629 [Picochlorum sp. BPE23]
MNDCRVSLLYTFGIFEAAAVGVSQRYPRDERRLLLLAAFCSCLGGICLVFFFFEYACTASGLFSTNECIARFLGP